MFARQTKDQSVRVVLGFYPAEEGNPQEAFSALGTGACLYGPTETLGSVSAESCARYSPLRLEGESLVVAETAPGEVQAIVQALGSAGSPAVFVLRPAVFLPRKDSAADDGVPSTKPEQRLLARLRQNEVTFDDACRDLEESVRLDHALTAAAEWLLDNVYLVTTVVGDIRRHFPRKAPALARGASDSHLYRLAQRLLAETDCSLNESKIEDCLREYQNTTPLTIAELWLFPLLFRIALIEALATLATKVSRGQQLREAAYLWANRLASSARRAPEVFAQMLARMEAEPAALEPYFAICLAEQLQDEEDALAPAQRWIEERLGTPLTELVQTEHNREAAERVSTANAFGSLRTLSQLDFHKTFEGVSLVEAELAADPAGVYPRSDFATRDRCRHVVEIISRHSGLSEIEVARRAVMLATQATDPGMQHAAYYLLSDGVRRLEAEVRARMPFRTRFIRAILARAVPLYIGGVVGLTVCFAALSLATAWDLGVRHLSILAVLGALVLFPLSELSIQIVNALVISLLPPSRLPKMDFENRIPPEHATLVVVPMMLNSLDVVRRELEKLEVRFLANPEPNLFFSLFSDFTDSVDPSGPADADILKAIREGIADLNSRYPGDRFLLFHRRRVWSESEQLWIGRERKRGKLEELNAFLCGQGNEEIRNIGRLPLPIRHVITLDADTQLPAGAARRMVETIAHPLNQVEIDPVKRTRRRGFAVIQPRVSIALPDATATRFTRVFADSTGTDPYCQTVSDAQQDLFGEAIFHGKAIYDVQAFCAVLKDRFPLETLLSHDLIEGAHVGVGLATDIELFENLPLTYSSYSKRQHRWIRGDWQIAPWIFPSVPAPGRRARTQSAQRA